MKLFKALEILFTQFLILPNIIHFPVLDSTNTFAKAHLETLQHSDVIVADIQTAGRGQKGHPWRSDVVGNVYASIVLKPQSAKADDLPALTQVLASAIIGTLLFYGVDATMKWPNDVMVGGKKIAGILAEAITQGQMVKGVVLRFGVNLTMPQTILDAIDQPATSLNILIEKLVNRDAFLGQVMARFMKTNHHWPS